MQIIVAFFLSLYSVFRRGGLTALESELHLEMSRISERNLGRDDRIISDHGREARFPYLDENVISYLKRLPLSVKADLTLPRGVGEKLLLRQVAKQFGLIQAASLPKRAMQFGSRIASAEGSVRLKGSADRVAGHIANRISRKNQKTVD
ncbi:Asparagine synthetase domain-containing protein 1 [Fasciolopsis buskii]|uniref:Asparagine synthetase domain-containing protein 1 n=1 Tax=Fasciolopsis buskii TaxID=27845 RepID=A0A8E0RPM6_9TREM|nr:Asparagine synthetase domain-containing protein 1 [Fasciolopsis buski]